jgi:hypothetical protein
LSAIPHIARPHYARFTTRERKALLAITKNSCIKKGTIYRTKILP